MGDEALGAVRRSREAHGSRQEQGPPGTLRLPASCRSLGSQPTVITRAEHFHVSSLPHWREGDKMSQHDAPSSGPIPTPARLDPGTIVRPVRNAQTLSKGGVDQPVRSPTCHRAVASAPKPFRRPLIAAAGATLPPALVSAVILRVSALVNPLARYPC